jgi:hypothetical protein
MPLRGLLVSYLYRYVSSILPVQEKGFETKIFYIDVVNLMLVLTVDWQHSKCQLNVNVLFWYQLHRLSR